MMPGTDTTILPLAHGGTLELGHPLVMGILNATPDSFSDGGEIDDPAARARRIDVFLNVGVDIIDVGGESTRPGHTPVPADEEINRVLPVIADVRARHREIPISIDTRKPVVADAAIAAGASFVNDVSGFADADMGSVVADAGCAYVGMRSADCEGPIVDACRRQLGDLVDRAAASGVPVANIVVDPGLGFGPRPGPSVEDNLALIDGVAAYSLGRPVLIGASRKRFVRAISGESKEAVIAGSVGLALRAVQAGASIVRVHDVDATIAALAATGLRPRDRGDSRVSPS